MLEQGRPGRYLSPTDYVDLLVAEAASGRTVEIIEPTTLTPVITINGQTVTMPERLDGWEVAADLLYRCGMDAAATSVRQNGVTFDDHGARVRCSNRPFDGRMHLQLVAD